MVFSLIKKNWNQHLACCPRHPGSNILDQQHVFLIKSWKCGSSKSVFVLKADVDLWESRTTILNIYFPWNISGFRAVTTKFVTILIFFSYSMYLRYVLYLQSCSWASSFHSKSCFSAYYFTYLEFFCDVTYKVRL